MQSNPAFRHRLAALGLASTLLVPWAQVFAANPMQQRMESQLNSRFQQADVNHDGRLTLDEARAGMPLVAQRFTQIDSAHQGFVTLQQIHAEMLKEMAQRAQTSRTP